MATAAIAAPPQSLRQNEWWLMGSVILVLAMLLVPLPSFLLDLLLTLHLAGALVIFFAVLMLTDALQFSSFPSVLLFAALFRTALSVAVVRSILINASGGQLVTSVGTYVLGGNFLVGIVLFLTLVIVQFVVVTGGANRIAEVAARFTLDALPGKQMSIDADLSAGVIDDEEARRRRRNLERQADFYAAMDGASKFVRGDAITALLVGALCFFGGIAVAVWQHHEPWSSALETYALLTVGQGLLIQIPALLVSAGSGFIVTRAASNESLGNAVMTEAKSQPDALMTGAIVAGVFGLLPGFPKLPFLVLSGALAAAVWTLRREQAAPAAIAPSEKPAPIGIEDFAAYVRVDPVELELGFALVSMAVEKEGGKLLERITNLRLKLAEDMGLVVPPIRVRDNLLLKPNNYAIRVRGARVSEAECHPHRLLAVGGPSLPPLDGFATTDPAFDLPAFWIEPEKKREAERAGYTCVDAETAIITHLAEVMKTYAPEILSRQEVQEVLDQVRNSHPAVVEEVTPQLLSRGEITQVLCNLLAETVPIKDMVAILEALSDGARISKDADYLTERVRRRLARIICAPFTSANGELAVIALDPEVERRLLDAVQETDNGRLLVPDAALWQQVLSQAAQIAESIAGEGVQPALVCSGALRLPLRRLLGRSMVRMPVLSYDEVNIARATLKTRAVVGADLQ